ncbi:radical SAM protein [Candidatus Pacearchaeota archaeon]|nr:radical SAM protein [Candidatus Pacearchaeota archaeon]
MKIANRKESGKDWYSWSWQQQNAIRDVRDLKDQFTQLPPSFLDDLHARSGDKLKVQLTPYMLEQIPASLTQKELEKNAWFLQFFPLGDIYTQGPDAYNGTDNWENGPEFPTSNLHHKYTNRAVVRFRNCLAYCNFCFEALGTLEKDPSPLKTFKWNDWQKSLDYLAQNPNIEEVILSGGEPLLLADSKLENILRDISQIKDSDGKPKIRFKRIHTRVMTHNPYRVTDDLVRILADYKVNEIALHVAHPSEITNDVIDAIGKIREGAGRYAPLIATHTPLLNGLNDNADNLWELFGKLFENNIKPYYLLHTMPHTPYANQQRVSVRDGVKLMKQLKRHKSNIAIPEYVIVHYDGKQTVPLELGGTPEFQYAQDPKGNPIIKFINWKGNWVEYPDTQDTIIS